MAVATALHSAVTGGIKAVIGCDWDFVLLFVLTASAQSCARIPPEKEKLFQVWNRFSF